MNVASSSSLGMLWPWLQEQMPCAGIGEFRDSAVVNTSLLPRPLNSASCVLSLVCLSEGTVAGPSPMQAHKLCQHVLNGHPLGAMLPLLPVLTQHVCAPARLRNFS